MNFFTGLPSSHLSPLTSLLSSILNPQSSIFNLQSSIFGLQSSVFSLPSSHLSPLTSLLSSLFCLQSSIFNPHSPFSQNSPQCNPSHLVVSYITLFQTFVRISPQLLNIKEFKAKKSRNYLYYNFFAIILHKFSKRKQISNYTTNY